MSTNYDERLEQERIWNYNRANRFKSIKDYFKEADGDFDSSDIEYDVTVTCVEPFDYKIHSSDEYYDRFTYYIYENVNVIGEENDKYGTVCDWTGFVYKHYDTLQDFMHKHWAQNYTDDDDFCYEWIIEINGYLAGYTREPMYKELYKMLKADEDKPDCERYKQFYNETIAPFVCDISKAPEPIRKEYEYSQLTYDYVSEDFQSEIIGGGYPVQIAVNTSKEYAFIIPCESAKEGFEENYNDALKECKKYGKKHCSCADDFNRLASSIAEKSDFRARLEVGDDDLGFDGIVTPTTGGRK